MKRVIIYEEKPRTFFPLLSKNEFLAQSEDTFKYFFLKSPKHAIGHISDIIASKEIFLFTCGTNVTRGAFFPGEEKSCFLNTYWKFAVRNL